jgi:hypothetical protein
MAVSDDKPPVQPGAVSGLPDTAVYPPTNVSAIAIDLVTAIFHTGPTVKFYMARQDFDVFGRTFPQQTTPVVQVVMPVQGFASMAIFFRRQLDVLAATSPDLAKMVADIEAEYEKLKPKNG